MVTMATPKFSASCLTALSPDPVVLSVVQVLDYSEPLVRTSSEPPASCTATASSPSVLNVVQRLDSSEPLMRAASRNVATCFVQVLDSDEPLLPLCSLFPIPGCSSSVDPLAGPTGSSNRRMNNDEIRALWNHKRLYSKLGTHESCIEFAEQRGMIPTRKMCMQHRRPMTIKSTGQMGMFRCRKSNCRTKGQSRAAGTWFENAHLPLPIVFELMYAFSHNNSYETVQRDTKDDIRSTVLSHKTISAWYNYCRETVVVNELENQSERPLIGGPGKVVHIDESKFGARKFNRGHQVEGNWVLGMVEEGCDDLRVELCPDNEGSADVLAHIKKHVQEGSIIHTDFWRAYDCLSEHGFTHKKENRLVTPGATHTRRIESPWLVIKRAFHKENNKENFADWLTEFSWRRRIAINRLDPFEELLKCVSFVYNVN